MTRLLGRYVSLEMALLCMAELLLSFLALHAVLATTAPVVLPGLATQTNFSASVSLTIALSALAIGLYRPEVCLHGRRLLVASAVAGAVAFPLILILSQVCDIQINPYYVAWLAKVLLVWVVCMLATRWIYGFAVRHRLFSRPLVIVGTGARAQKLSTALNSQPGHFFDVIGMTDAPALAGPQESGKRLWGVVVAPEPTDRLPAEALLDGKRAGLRIVDDVRFWEQHLGRIDLDHVGPDWLVFSEGFVSSRFADAAKRLCDLVLAGALLCLTVPLMAVVALLIKLDSAGPVLYRQERVGLHGRVFTVLKFRSMRVDAEAGTPRWASKQDPRVTRIGGVMRLTRIDELPQILNVLKGEMSFVGPRPERPHFVEQLEQVIPLYRERNWVKPGITGWAQVNYPYGASIEDAREKLAYDLYYVKNRSLMLDLLILVSTVRVILFQEGAR